MIENSLLTKLNERFNGSPLVKLFLLLIFKQTFDPILEIDRNSDLKNYVTDCEYESLVFHNGCLSQEDHKYLYNTILKFEQQTNPDEKEKIVFQFLDSQAALEIITEEFDNDPENYDEDGTYIADDKEIFNKTREYLLRKYLKSTQENLLPENVKKWLTHLCIGVSLNFSTDFGNDEDTLQELFCSKIKKGDELGCMY